MILSVCLRLSEPSGLTRRSEPVGASVCARRWILNTAPLTVGPRGAISHGAEVHSTHTPIAHTPGDLVSRDLKLAMCPVLAEPYGRHRLIQDVRVPRLQVRQDLNGSTRTIGCCARASVSPGSVS